MKLALVTICTNRKKFRPNRQMCVSNLPKGDQKHILLNWKTRVQESGDKIPAINLYSGRGIFEIRKISQTTQIDLWFISAGLGLISWDYEVPPYNLTISASVKGSIQAQLLPISTFCRRKWWSGLNLELYGTANPIYDLITNRQDTIFVFSLSQAYLDLISSDLFSLGKKDLGRVRLLGFKNPEDLPVEFRDLWMPYDDRFDGPDSPIPGTRSDFPQRVTRHFVEQILCKNLLANFCEHATKVANILRTMRPPTRIIRPSRTDDQIKEIIMAHWDEAKGSGARMLRILRDEENIACEQGRFAALFRQIKARM